MPDATPYYSLLRSTTHGCTLRLVVDVPTSIWTARVDGDHAAAVNSVRVHAPTVTKTPFLDCLVYFSATAYGANDLGVSRFKSYSAPNLSVPPLPFAVPDDSYVTVFEYIPPVAKIPKQQANSLTSEDNDTQYTNQNTNFKPLCNFGPPAIAVADPITGLATINFYDSSIAMATGATITGPWAWVFPDGTPGTSAAQGTSGAPIAVSFPIGRHYVSLEVTDSNGKKMKGYRVVWVLDPAALPLASSPLEIGDLEQDVEGGGFSTAVKVYNVATDAVFPDGAQVVFYADEKWRDGEGATTSDLEIGGAYVHRENIKMVGYIREGSLSRNWKAKTVEFKVDGIGIVLSNLAGVASNHNTTSGTPSNWHEFYNLVPDMIGFHVLMEHSTVAEICDIRLTSLDYKLKFCDLQEGNLRDQLAEVFASVRSRLGSNLQGMLYAEPNPQLLPLASRTQPKIMDVGLGDLRDDVEIGTERYEKTVSQIQFFGFAYAQDSSGNWVEKPWNSLAPAVRYATGANQRVDGIRANSQNEANALAGLYEGLANNDFDEIVLHFRGNFSGFLDGYPAQYLTLTVPASANARGLAFTATKLWIKRVTHSYKAGILLTDAVCEKDSFGAPGITGPYPPEPPGETPTGCCALPDGTTQTMTQADCIAAGGTYMGDSAPCPGPSPTGCCTFPDGSTSMLTSADCSTLGGVWAGANVPCTPGVTPHWVSHVYLLTTLGVYYSADFTGPSGAMPHWTLLNTGLPASYTPLAIEPDAWNPDGRQYLLIRNDVNGIYELYSRTGGAWSKLVDGSDAGTLAGLIISDWGGTIWHWSGNPFYIYAIQSDINVQGYLGLWACVNIGDLYFLSYTNQHLVYFYTTDYGATWHIQTKPAAYIAAQALSLYYGEIGDYAGGGYAAGDVMYAPLYGSFAGGGLGRSVDRGMTWTRVIPGATMDFGSRGFLTDVYENVVYEWLFGVIGTAELKRSTDTGATFGADLIGGAYALTHTGTGTRGAYRYRFHALLNGSSGAQVLRLALDDLRVLKSTDAGATWTPHTTSGLASVTELGLSLVYHSADYLYGLALNHDGSVNARAVFASEDDGETWTARAGDNCAVAPYTSSVPYSAKTIAILQVWTS